MVVMSGFQNTLVFREDAVGSRAYYVHNGHGDVVELRDELGDILNEYRYNIWGVPEIILEGVDNPFLYAGEMWDVDADLYYLRARWYDPHVGRFISKDTYEGELTNPLSLNLYTYGYNNPLRYTDPTGHCGFDTVENKHSCFVDFTPILGSVKSGYQAFIGENPYNVQQYSTGERWIEATGIIPYLKYPIKGIIKGGKASFTAIKKLFTKVPVNVLSNKTFTNSTGKVKNYTSPNQGMEAARADFNALNPTNVRTAVNILRSMLLKL